MGELLLIAGGNNPLTADFISHRRRSAVRAGSVSDVRTSLTLQARTQSDRLSGIVVFLDRTESDRQRALLEALAEIGREKGVGCACIVSTWLVHLGDRKAARAEALALERLASACAKVVVLRPGHVLSEQTPLSRALQWMGEWLEAIPPRFRSCCVESATLFRVIEQELIDPRRGKGRIYTLLGPNRPWSALAPIRQPSRRPGVLLLLAKVLLNCFLVEQLVTLAFALLARRFPWLRAWNFDTLHPESVGELLALYNKHNYPNIKIVGYNNGVTHFGHRFPGKTVVSTIRCARPARVGGGRARFDAGTTIRAATDALRTVGKELHVLPNYSYVSLGTSYFVPIHGSACTFSTIAETIDKVLLYDPVRDRFLVARRGQPDFGHYMYNLRADVLLLRLYLRVREKSRYYVQRQELVNPSSEEVLSQFHNDDASNVELRKAGAQSRTVQACKYYHQAPDGDAACLEVPRDALGSLWDRLEENRLTRTLFHGLTRRFVYHVELFLSEAEFAVFWDTHGALPIKKIQLRSIKRDGLPHSPFQKGDCISADLFMLKKHRGTFDAYLKEKFGAVRMNPGKHSM